MTARERAVAAALMVAIAGSLGFIVAYAFTADRIFEGVALAVACAGFSAAAAGWAFWIVPQQRVVDERTEAPSPSQTRAAENRELGAGEAQLTRRTTLVRLFYAALAAFGAALVVPVRSLGHAPDGTLFHTKWKRGDRLVREDGRPLTRDDLQVDSVVTVFPEGAIGDPQSQTVLIRVPDDLAADANGYVAYSKICTHAGCPVALYRATEHQLMCPCHQSIFDVLDAGRVVSGPADHALPQLPIEIDGSGFIRARGDFPDPVGPGFWERG